MLQSLPSAESGATVSTSTKEITMFTLITLEHQGSQAEVREGMTMAQAYALASKGGFYKAQIVNEFGVVDYEF